MKIAVSYNNGVVADCFSKTDVFKIYTAKKGQVLSQEIIDASEVKSCDLPEFLGNNEVDVVLCGGIGAKAKNALAKECIVFFPGVVGKADHQIKCFLEGSLSFNPMLSCTSMGEEKED